MDCVWVTRPYQRHTRAPECCHQTTMDALLRRAVQAASHVAARNEPPGTKRVDILRCVGQVLKSLDNGSGGYQELYNSMFQGQAQAVLVDTLGLHWDELPDTQFSPSELVFAVDGHYPHADDFLRAVAPVVPNRPAYVRHFVYICHLLFGTGGSLRATRESLLLCVQRAGLWGATAEVLDSMTALASDEDFLAMLSRYGDADDAV